MESILSAIEKGNKWLNNIVWGWPMIILILGTGILLTILTRVMQIRKLGESMSTTIVPTVKSLGKKKGEDKTAKSISQFEAFATAISGTVGTGNIIGVTSAILTGGPGAVFWMWISAFFGMITNYSENVLGLYFRKKDKEGNFSGGAFYYISEGLGKGWKWLGYLAAAFCMLAAIGMSAVQTNKISGTLSSGFANLDAGTVKLVVGIIVAIVAALVIIGGIKRIGRVASILVPFMSVLFLVLSIIIIIMHIGNLGAALGAIFKYAFNFKAVGGGIFGYTFGTIIKKGMARGVFSNEAGLGSSVIAHSASETREPVRQGLWGIFEVFFDTFIICTLTALSILSTYDMSTLAGEDSAVALGAFSNNFGMFGTVCFCIILPLFAFTTILAWSYYGEKGTEFLFQKLGEKGQKAAVMTFKVIFVVLIVVSAIINGELAWAIADTFNGLMAIPNLVAVILLSGLVVKITKNYYDRKNGARIKPMLSHYEKQNEEFIKDINTGDPRYN
jgi:AGCS family alanine or glycine:cation symporter